MSLNLAHCLDMTAQTYPNKTALILDDFRMPYAVLAMSVRKIANVLKGMGIGRGDKVAMMIPNTPHFPIIYYGVLYVGATVVPLNCLLKSNEIQYMLEDSEAEAFFTWKLFEEDSVAAFRQTETCHHFVVVSTPDDTSTPGTGESFMTLMNAASVEFDIVQTMPDDTAVILYTSGTTGTPKGAELTHFNMFFNAFYAKEKIVEVQAEDIGLAVLPLFHTFGQTCIMNLSLMAGATLTMLPTFDTQKTMEVIQRDKVTVLAAVPTMYYWMLAIENSESYDLSSLRMAVSGGSAMPVDVFDRFKERYGVQILEGYGLTETSPIASFTVRDGPSKPGSIGKPIWGVDMRIMKDDGAFAEPDEVGEVVVRGHNVMKGYYKKPGATEEAIVDGWFHTGDLGKTDKDGFFYIVDRKKDLIIRGGMNIYPREIEEALFAHPDVVEVCVVGVPDAARGEEVKAYVVPRQDVEVTPDDLQTYCKERMARYKVPKSIEFMDNLPKGPTGKVLKRELRDMMARQA